MSNQPRRSYRRPHARPRLQTLEDRWTPANFIVGSTADSGAGSLREAIGFANANPTDADTITFDASFNTARTISLTSGELAITTDVTITGPGANLLTVRRDPAAATNFRVFDIENAAAVSVVSLSGMRVSGGLLDTGDGAGIFTANEAVTFDSMIISGNSLTSTAFGNSGGGIATGTNGSLTIRNTTISGNAVAGHGGGIYVYDGGAVLIDSSTISGNTAGDTVGGAGIYFYGTPSGTGVTIRNSTIANNTATNGNGGGICFRELDGAVAIQNSTITGNSAQSINNDPAMGYGGGGISILANAAGSAPVVVIQSSIVSGNTANAANGHLDISSNPLGVVNIDHSAIGSSSGFNYSDPSGTNLPLGAALNLGALADNGGPTFTIAIPFGSPAFDAGSNPANVTTDQRGHARPQPTGGNVDIGAYEKDTGTPSATATFSNVVSAGAAPYTFAVTYADPGSAIALGTLGDDDVRITGPNGFNVLATHGVDDATDPNSVIANYSFNPPLGSWDLADNGTYTVSIEPGSVTNSASVPVPAGSLGTFQALIAATFHVTTTADAGAGSLRAALDAANLFGTADTIVFDAPAFGTNPATIALASALPVISEPVTLTGPGAGLLTVSRPAGAGTSFRVFTITSATPFAATLTGLTISGGATAGAVLGARGGGGVLIGGSQNVTIENSIVSGNTASGEGGGVYVGVRGTLTIRNSTVSGNTAGTDAAGLFRSGGGIYFQSGGTLLMENCTVSGNSTPTDGGGIYFYGYSANGNWTIRNSTIAGNTAGINGGGISALSGAGAHTLSIQSSTIANNAANGIAAAQGGGGLAVIGTFTTVALNDSVVANNTSALAPDVLGTANASFSLVRSGSGATLPNYATQNNLPIGTDPLLSAAGLADNGGPTQTIELQPASLLIDSGPLSLPGVPFDQRGSPFQRVRGAAVDIGAFEVQSTLSVLQTQVNDGSIQRSRVTSLTVTLSTAVNFSGAVANAFTLIRDGDNAAVNFTATAIVNGLRQTVVTLSNFTDGVVSVTEFGSLADGRYTLTALASQISNAGGQLNGGANYVFGDVDGLYRYYGDVSGDRRVDIFDFGFFSPAYLAPPNYNAALDFNNDGRIDIADVGQFSVRYFTSLP